MNCKVKRDPSGKFIDVVIQDRKNPDSTKTDPLYASILAKVTKDPQSYIDTDEFIRGLYSSNLLVDVTKEEIALGIWAKVHQFWINNNTAPKAQDVVQQPALTPKDEAYFPPMPQSMATPQPTQQDEVVKDLNNDKTLDTWSNDIVFQNISNEDIIASEKTIRDLAARMSDRIGIPVRFESDRTKEYKGKLEGGRAVINLAYASLDTPIHEILGHPIIRSIKNSKNNYLDQIKVGNSFNHATTGEKVTITKVDEEGTVTLEHVDGTTEYTQAEDYYFSIPENPNTLYQNLLKELETGRGRKVLDRIKRDYVNKNQYTKEDFSIKEEEQFDIDEGKRVKRFIILNNKNPYAAQPIYKNIEGAQKEIERLTVIQPYTLEEQQEEAIVELLGMMTAEKLDTVKDGKLISLLKRLLKEMKAFIRSLLTQREVEIDKLPDNITLEDLSNLLAYSNSKLILPGNEVVYTTPDNQQFKTYTEASKYIDELAKSVEDIDLDNININTLKEKSYWIRDGEDGDVIESGLTLEEAIIKTDELNKGLGEYTPPYFYDESQIKNESSNQIINFIEKNKEYEQSKEIIEEWKKVNNIQYNPEEIYSRGQEFVSVVGAYSSFDVNLMMQNLLTHIEDNEKAGGKFAISAFTKPIDKKIGHLEGGGGKIKFKIYPQSQDILWAANTDVYSGSVWDASEKVNKDKKSELLGVSYTKYPALRNVNTVQPNLASVVDDLAHHHNELGIVLSGNNFRLEYDFDIPYQTKKIIDGINSILDQKYGKLVKPTYNKSEKKETGRITIQIPNDEGGYYTTTFDSEKEYKEWEKNNERVDHSIHKETKVNNAIQPTQTNETLKESIESIKNNIKFDKPNIYKIEDIPNNFTIKNKKGEDLTIVKDNNGIWKAFHESGEFQEFSIQKVIEAYNKKQGNLLQKEYTSQALINTKISKLKEVAKKYPRSLIRSEVVPINLIQRANREQGFEEMFGDELPFQKLPSSQINQQVQEENIASEQILDTNLVDEMFQEYDDSIESFKEFENLRSFDNLNEQIEKNIRFTEKRLSELRRQKRELKKGDSDKNKELNEKIARQERKKEEYNAQLRKAKSLDGLTAIEEMADKVLDEYRNMLSSDDLSLTDLDHVNNNVRFWLAVGTLDPYKREHILYGDEELSEDMRSRLGSIGVKANDIYNHYIEKQLNAMQKEILKKLKGEKKYLIDQLTETKDISWWQQNTLDISTYGDAVLALIQVHEKEAVTAAQVKIAELVNKLEAAFEPVKNRLGKNYDIFKQKNADGSKTNRLVYRFTPEFFEAAREARFKLKTDKDYAKFIDWLGDNEIVMNPIILFPTKLGDDYHWGQSENMYSDYDEAMREKHIQELKDTLGEKDFEMYKKNMEEKISSFVFQYNETKADLIGQGLSGEDLETALKDWELQKSPYYFVQRALHGKKLENSQGIIVKNDGYSYVNTVPKRFKKDGSETGYYDKNYENIQADPKLAELYNQVLEITSELADMLSPSKRKELGINGLPFLRKDISELFGRGNIIGMSEGLYEQFIEMTRSQAFGDTDTQERDPITGRVKFKARLHLETEEQTVKDMVESKWIKYTIENTAEMKKMSKVEKELLKQRITKEFKKQVVAEMQKDRSEDLMTTMKAYIMATVMYHHKSNIEDMLNIISQIAEDRSAFGTKDGVIQNDPKTGKPKLAEHAEKKREALRYNLEVFLTGKARATEGQTKKKILTRKEKSREKELKDLLESLEQKFLAGEINQNFYESSKKELDDQIANLGGVVEGSRVGDMALKLVQLKGIGWNILSGLNNMAFGYVANSIEAAAGEFFDDPSLAKSRRMLTSSAVTNMTFNHYRNAESKKIRKMIDLFDILKDASSELFKAGNKSPIASKFRWLGAYQANKRTEYINQGQTFIAYMLFNKVKDLNGKEFSMWEAFDDNGVWKTEEFGEMDMSKFSHTKTSVDQLIKRLHGNYDELSPVMGKKYIAGRSLFQFKSWFPETWRKYWGKETPDFILGDNYKGRYLSAIDAFSTDWKKTTGATVAEFLRKYMNVTSFGLIKNFSDPNAFNHLTKVDMMNMKRNIHQLIFMSNLVMLYYMLKYLAEDDDDKVFNAAANLAIHQIARLSGELEMYSSPTSLADFTKNLFPASVIIKDLSEITTAVVKTIGGDTHLQSGTYENWHRIPKETMEAIPFIAPAMSTYNIFSGKSKSKEATLIEAAIGD